MASRKPRAAARDDEPEEETTEQIMRKADGVMDESVSASRRIVAMAEETRTSGAKTLEMLDEQGQTLNRVENAGDKIDKNLAEANKQLSTLERWCCGCCAGREPEDIVMEVPKYTSKGKPNPNTRQPQAASKMEDRGRKQGGKGTRHAGDDDDDDDKDGRGGKGGRGGRIMKDDAREDELESNLDVVSDILGDLKAQAHQMGATVDAQNEQISRLSANTDRTLAHTKQANKRTEKLLS
eukprot:Unigene2596_Nuclearia_a/m.8012 Unigene2596_Nuclearia_a/g.8012  ORF Unigene2596_Nuclearia_a/g.8012 Unigene2596_Nuclearia_a/m.8012 type:complete len:238 (+) Unigene2596_Nuclearia_a:19-732(+)